ncbi:hypothetical protein JVU11DRAFT_3976 [Chiua virens]|nr:hypothetical protein JVU11DRAFT_3976 [Chiua virens]
MTHYYTNASSLSLADLDVLVLDYDLLFAASDSYVKLHHLRALYDLADRLPPRQKPSILRALLQNDDDGTGKYVKYVWLATDHPLPLSAFTDTRVFPIDEDGTLQNKSDNGRLGVTKSSAFKSLSSEHDDAI